MRNPNAEQLECLYVQGFPAFEKLASDMRNCESDTDKEVWVYG